MTATQTLHASCVAYRQKAALITGASGTGKSALALTLIGMGCDLVADDRVLLCREDHALIASCPKTISGLIEARGVGILNAAAVPSAQVALMIDLDQTEQDRLPKLRTFTLLQQDVPLIHAITGPHFPAAVLQILKAGWSDR